MASLKDALLGIFSNNNNEYEMKPLQPNLNLPFVQLKNDGTGTVQPYNTDMNERPVGLGQKLGYTFLGVPEKQVVATDDNGNEVYQQTGRRGGIFNDVANGFNDNYATGFAVGNLTPDKEKNWATRIGEGLGTAARFVDSPAGRGLITAGLIGAVGGNPAQMLGYGLTGAVGRQNYMTADKLYRNQLKQYGYTDDDLAKIRGNVTNDMYKNLTQNLYRTRNLDQNSYIKLKNFYDKQLQNGILSPEEYKTNMDALNSQYVNSQARTIDTGNVGLSNQTRNTDSQIETRKQMIDLNKQKIAILQQRVNNGIASETEKSVLRNLMIEQKQLENELYKKELGIGGSGTPAIRPVGQTKSGVKYKVVR